MNSSRCPTCLGKGYFKRLGEASPPYYADDEMKTVECLDCVKVEDVVEVVRGIMDVFKEKSCPWCHAKLARVSTPVLCMGSLRPIPGHNVGLGRWICNCGVGCCEACYDQLED